MQYEFSGSIWLANIGKKKNAFSEVVNELLNEEDYDEYYNKYLEGIDYSSDYVNVDGGGDYDDMEAMKDLLMMICDKAIATYPECSLTAHYCGTNMSSSTEWAFSVEYKNHHVKKYEIEGNNDCICCPECDECVVSYGDVQFSEEYECDECGRIMTAEEISEEISDWVEEYDIESPTVAADGCSNEPVFEIEFAGKKFVTTGLSAADERWVQEQVESKGGEYKPKFVVSLDYLIYNPHYDHETTKYIRAKEQIEKGKPIKIITFEEFKKSVQS